MSKQKKLIIARPNSEWQIVKWDKDISILDEHNLNIAALIKEEEEL